MIGFKTSPRRVKKRQHVSVALQDSKSKKVLSGRLHGIATDITKNGASVILPRMMVGGRHLFFSTLNSTSHNLLLTLDPGEPRDTKRQIRARAVCMDGCTFQDGPAYRLAINFLNTQEKF